MSCIYICIVFSSCRAALFVMIIMFAGIHMDDMSRCRKVSMRTSLPRSVRISPGFVLNLHAKYEGKVSNIWQDVEQRRKDILIWTFFDRNNVVLTSRRFRT